MARPGPTLKINDETIETIATAISIGVTRWTASKYAKITYQTFITWYHRGEVERDRIKNGIKATRAFAKQEEIYLRFLREIEQAEADALVGWQNTINIAARTDPAWAHKMASLRDPRGYRSTEVSFSYDLNKATIEQLERIAAGEDPITVMADTGTGVVGTAPPTEPTDE